MIGDGASDWAVLDDGVSYDAYAPLVIIGAGACGLTAALAAIDAGATPLVLERDDRPMGSTALSSGFIPAAGTRWQAAAGVDDDPATFLADIQAKSKDRSNATVARSVATTIGPTLEWLADAHALEFVLVDGFLYPGHSVLRMHATPEKTGAGLMARLLAAAESAGVAIATNAQVRRLYVTRDGAVSGVDVHRPDGAVERVACDALALACNGFGGDRELVGRHIPEMRGALYFGHAGNTGDALRWGDALGLRLADLSGYQGHGSVADPHGALITWALMMQGGVQVNRDGRRFSNELQGYSEQAVAVLAQPGGVAFNLYDARLHELGLDFADYRAAYAAGAVKQAQTIDDLAAEFELPSAPLRATVEEVAAYARNHGADPFGRSFDGVRPWSPPFYAVRVTGALFHTQGGVAVDADGRAMRQNGAPHPNLFAGGGAAVGVSGPDVSGYLSGNGLLTAIALGRSMGRAAGGQVAARSGDGLAQMRRNVGGSR